jgi:hypothetical protein
MASIILAGNADPTNVLSGKTFSAGLNYNTGGTMPNQGSVMITPSGTGQVSIPAGYHDGTGKVSQVSVDANKVLAGTTIAGVAGVMVNNGAKTFTPSSANQTSGAGYYTGVTVNGDVNLIASNILSGKSIFGIAGSIVARQYASGTVVSSSTYESFTKSDTSVGNYYYIQVSGLTFKPSVVVGVNQGTQMCLVYESFENLSAGSSLTGHVFCSGASAYFPESGTSVYCNSTGFRFPVSGMNYTWHWYAFG